MATAATKTAKSIQTNLLSYLYPFGKYFINQAIVFGLGSRHVMVAFAIVRHLGDGFAAIFRQDFGQFLLGLMSLHFLLIVLNLIGM